MCFKLGWKATKYDFYDIAKKYFSEYQTRNISDSFRIVEKNFRTRIRSMPIACMTLNKQKQNKVNITEEHYKSNDFK